jgi:dihydrofolate reductase
MPSEQISAPAGGTVAAPDLSSAAPRCSVFIASSVDGFIARDDGSIDWLLSVQLEGEDYGYGHFIDSVDCFVLGRRTYETILKFDSWPYAGRRCVVLTSQQRTSRHGEEFFSGPVSELADRLGRDGVRHVYVDGGMVIQQFLAAQLVDELILSIVPVILGGGVRLFGAGGLEQPLRLAETRTWPTGLIQLRYRRAR